MPTNWATLRFDDRAEKFGEEVDGNIIIVGVEEVMEGVEEEVVEEALNSVVSLGLSSTLG